MRKTIALIIALALTTVNNPLLALKLPNKQKKQILGKAKKELTKKVKASKDAKKEAKKKSKQEAKEASAKDKQSSAKGKKASAKGKKASAKESKKESKAAAHQLKEEIKAWKKKKKDMQPLQLKDLIEENHRLKTQNRNLDIDLHELEIRIKAQQENIEALNKLKAEQAIMPQSGIGSMPRDLEELPADSYTIDQESGQVLIDGIPDTRYGVDKATGKPFIKGIIFKVQVSATKDIDLGDVLADDSHHTSMEQEKADSLNKYTIGQFANYWEADKLKKGLRKMGIKWAWIVPYKNGKRVLLKEVLGTVISGKQKQ